MSFWGGVARGFKDSEAKKERDADREERDAARLKAAEYQDKMFKYSSNRDSILDKRYEDQTRVERERHAETAALTAANRAEDTAYRAGRDKVGDTAAKETWEMTVEKWDATKDSVKQAQENADRIFNQSIKAFNATTKQYDAQSLRADSAEARAVASALYQKERDAIGDTAAATNRDDRINQWNTSVEQWNKQFGLSENADARAQDAVELARTEQILSMMPAGMSTSLGGGKVKGASDDTSITPEAMKAGSTAFKAELANMGEDEQSSEFFEAAARSPGAQATIMGFMEAQAKKGNTIDLADMPKYFKYLGSAPGKGESEAKEFMESMISGDANIGDKDTFIKGLTAMKNFRATKEMFVQTSAPSSLTDQNQQYQTWKEAVKMEASRAARNLPPEQREDIDRARSMLKIEGDSQEGMDLLASMGFGRTLAMSGNYANHPLISSYYNQDTEAAAPVVAEPVVADTPPQPPAPVADADVTTFDTWEEAAAAQAKGFSGKVLIAGQPGEIVALPGAAAGGEEPAADLTAAALKPPTAIADDSGFLGTGKTERPALPKNTDIDAMFGDVFDSKLGVEESAPTFERKTNEVEGITIEEGIPGIEKAVENFEVAPEDATRAAELRESQGVQMVIQELEDMGIEWPTNREELGFFRDDLVSLVTDYQVEIPDEIMSKIIDRAKEQSGVGIIPQGDLDRIMRAKDANDKDTLSNLMNKYGVGPVTDAMGVGK
tara:strand:+ start:178 stop:2349 length:2172 start_codon:yes stop_codon:yes gene_type:complete